MFPNSTHNMQTLHMLQRYLVLNLIVTAKLIKSRQWETTNMVTFVFHM